MYHIGIVQHLIVPGRDGVVSSDTSVQAVVRMWDANLLILAVDPKIARKVKKNDYIIADYTPMASNSPNRKLLIIKILSPQEGSRVWADFQDEFDKKVAMVQQERFVR